MRTTVLALSAVLCACAPGDGAAPPAPARLGSDFPRNQFLQFFSKQPSLPGGDYRLVIAPAAPVAAGSYALDVSFDDGTLTRFEGAWTGAASSTPEPAGALAHAVTVQVAGGLVAVLDATAPACVYLYDANGRLLHRAGDDESQPDADCDGGAAVATLDLPASRTDDLRYAQAFYATVDPCDQRTSLEDWQAANGFGLGEDVHAIFRDVKDLGYGRDMHFRENADGSFAFYVRNYQVTNVPGTRYGPLNVEAAVAQLPQYHVGTNAIEWGPLDSDCDGIGDVDTNVDGVVDEDDFFTRHYTFEPGADGARRLMVDLDGKGPKAMPVPCILCHGGRADPLLPAPQNANPLSLFPRSGDTKARLQPFDVDSFEFVGSAPWSRPAQEAALRALNQAVYDSYAPLDARRGAGFPPTGEWDSSRAREMIEHWYAGTPAADSGVPGGPLSAVAFADDYVPAGWTVGGGAPADAEALYRDVIAQNCRTCHLLRGIGNFHNDDIDFTTYAKFIGHDDQLEHFVYDKGVMPLAYLTFGRFWDGGAPEQLAAFLDAHAGGGFVYEDDGSVRRPGAPVAKAGPDRSARSPVTVSGAASLFALDYRWEIVAGSGGSLGSPGAIRTTLSGTDGETYTLRLTVADARGQSSTDEVIVTIDDAFDPAQLTFEDDIRPLLDAHFCTSCHLPPTITATGPVVCEGVNPLSGVKPPVFWTGPVTGGGVGDDCPNTTNRDLYAEFRARVDFVDPENSRVLRKPLGNHHGGGQVFSGTADPGYQTFLNWILEGGRED